MKKEIFIILVLLVLCLILPAQAQDGPPKGPMMTMKIYKVDTFVKQVDTDSNGYMSKEEWKGAGLADLPDSVSPGIFLGSLSCQPLAARFALSAASRSLSHYGSSGR